MNDDPFYDIARYAVGLSLVTAGLMLSVVWEWAMRPRKDSTMKDNEYQTIELVLTDGRRLRYTGRAQIEPTDDIKVVHIYISEPRPLPLGMSFETLSKLEGVRDEG